jgi:hypothetical protein
VPTTILFPYGVHPLFLGRWALIVQCSIFAVAVLFALASSRSSGYAVAMTKSTDKDVSGRGEGKPSPWVDTRVFTIATGARAIPRATRRSWFREDSVTA